MATLTLKAPAKVNLFLEILGKRPDGYHQLETVLQEIDLADTITLKKLPSPEIIIRCRHPLVPKDNKNLAYKAADLLRKYIGEKKRGVVITIEKKIPIAAGLGGGSSDAAATLKCLNKLWKINFDKKALISLAERIGMDVPFFIQGGLCLGAGRGEEVSPLKPFPSVWVVLIAPSFKVSTAGVYGQFIYPLTRKIKKNRIIKAIRSGDIAELGGNLFNRLEEVTIKRYPQIRALKESLLRAGAKGALMSGSGPVVFGLFSSRKEAYRAKEIIGKHKEEVYVARNV